MKRLSASTQVAHSCSVQLGTSSIELQKISSERFHVSGAQAVGLEITWKQVAILAVGCV